MLPRSTGHACGFVKATCAACAEPVAAARTQPVDRVRDGVRARVRVRVRVRVRDRVRDRVRIRVLG